MSSNSFKIRLPSNYWLTNRMYNHLTVRKQLSSDSFTNAIYKLFADKWDTSMRTDYPPPKKRTHGSGCASGPLIDSQRKRKEKQILRSCQRQEKTVEYEGDCYTSNSWGATFGPQRFRKETDWNGNKNWNPIDQSSVKIG